MFKKGIYSNEARNKMFTGAEALAKSVKCTLGGKGRNAVLINDKGLPIITKDGVSVAQHFTDMKDVFENAGASLLRDIASRTVAVAGDGCQMLSAKIATPNGWTTMGEVKIGDTICGTNGTFQEVVGIFPKGKKDIYKITTVDGRTVECSDDHLWEVYKEEGSYKEILTLREMIDSNEEYYIPTTMVEFEKRDTKYTPYEFLDLDDVVNIPSEYLFNSKENREVLYNSFLDKYGIEYKGKISFEFKSENLANDFVELCRSIGKVFLKGIINPDTADETYGFYQIDSDIIKITSIEKTDKHEEVQCIKVSNDDHLYITDDFVVTHNTSTSVVLGEAIIKESLKHIKKGTNPIDLKKGIDKTLDFVLSNLDEMAIDVSSSEDIKRIATVSANGDEVIGQLIADAMDIVGYDGLIEVDVSNKIENELEVSEGMEIEPNHISHHFVDDIKNELVNPMIFLYDGEISRLAEIKNLLEIVMRDPQGRPIVIMCDDMRGEALAVFLKNIKNPQMPLNGIVMKAPSIGEFRDEIMKDIGVYTGGGYNSVINGGFDICNLNEDNLVIGTCEKMKIGKNSTTIIGGNYNQEELDKRAEKIEYMIENEADENLKARYKKRLAKLTGKLAYIKLGASSQVELKEKFDRVDDALKSTRCGVEEGIVAGGGIALYNISKMRFPKPTSKAEKISQDIIKKVAFYPFKTIMENSGINYKKIDKKLSSIGVDTYGFDVRGEKIVNMIDSGIIDPVKVTKTAFINAVSVAGLFITVECAIAPIKEDSDKSDQPMMMMPQQMMG